MAQDPIYKRSNIYDIETPKLNFDVYQQSIGTSRQVEAALDRMTGVALKEVGEKAAERGKRFAIDNPITGEQIIQATQSGETVSDLFVQDTTTTFGKNARKYQAKIARVDLEYLARKEFQDITLKVNAGLIQTKQQLEDAVNGVINGYGQALKGFDAEEELSMNASITSAGRQVVGTNLATLVKNFDASNIAQAEDYVNNIYVDELTNQLHEMDIKDPTVFEAFISSDELAVKNKINSIIDPTKRANLEKIALEKKRSVVQTVIAQDMIKSIDPEEGYADVIRKIRNGDGAIITKGKDGSKIKGNDWSAFLKDPNFVGAAGKEGIIKAIKTQYDQTEAALKSAEEAEKRRVNLDRIDLEREYLYSDDPEKQKNALQGLQELTKSQHYKYSDLMELQKKNVAFEDAQLKDTSLYLRVMTAIKDGSISNEEGLLAQTKGRITDSQARRVFGKALYSNEYRMLENLTKSIVNAVGTNGDSKQDSATTNYEIGIKIDKIRENNPEISTKEIENILMGDALVINAKKKRDDQLVLFKNALLSFTDINDVISQMKDDEILKDMYDGSPLITRIEQIIDSDPSLVAERALVKRQFDDLKAAIANYRLAIEAVEVQ
jgi:hypothetical protein